MKKKISLFIILVLSVLIAPRLFILSVVTWNYYHTNEICPPGTFPVIVYEVKPYAVITDRGNMYPGDEYELMGEGEWYGIGTLLFAGKDGATFFVVYDIDDPINGYSRPTCRRFVPVGDYR